METGVRVRATARTLIVHAFDVPPSDWCFRRSGCFWSAFSSFMLTVVAPHFATAQSTASAPDQRVALLADAEAARTSGDHARALELAQRAAAIRMSPSLALMIAQEALVVGRVVDGAVAARRCVADATGDVALRNRARILRLCTALADELGPRVGEVMVRTTTPPPGTRIEVSRRTVAPEEWGTAVPVEPGDVEVRATAPDGRTFARTLRVAAGERTDVDVAFAPERVASTPEPTTEALTLRTETARDAPPPRRRVGAGPWVLGGIGALAFASAGVFWALHESAVAERDAACDRTGCDPSSVASNERARDFTAATNVAFAVGGAALAAGVTWWIVAWSRRGDERTTTATRRAAWALPGPSGVIVGGTL